MTEPTAITETRTAITDSRPEGPPSGDNGPGPKPFVPDEVHLHEFTWPAVLVGVVLGIIFGASSLYLLLKVGNVNGDWALYVRPDAP